MDSELNDPEILTCILETLNIKTKDTLDNLHTEVEEYLRNNQYTDLNDDAFQHSISVGLTLGLFTLKNNIVRMAFKLRSNKPKIISTSTYADRKKSQTGQCSQAKRRKLTMPNAASSDDSHDDLSCPSDLTVVPPKRHYTARKAKVIGGPTNHVRGKQQVQRRGRQLQKNFRQTKSRKPRAQVKRQVNRRRRR